MEFDSSVVAIVGDVDGIPGSWLQPQPSKEHVDGESLSPLSLPVSVTLLFKYMFRGSLEVCSLHTYAQQGPQWPVVGRE